MRIRICVALVLLAASGSPGHAQPAPELAALGRTFQAFVNAWMHGDPNAVANEYIADLTRSHVAILPSGGGRGDANQQLGGELRFMRSGLWNDKPPDNPIVAATRGSLPDLTRLAQRRGMELTELKDPPVLTYRIRTWRDISWCGSAGPAQRKAFEGAFSNTLLVGLVAQLSDRDREAHPLLFLWTSQPGSSGWKLVSLFEIMTK